MTKHHSAPEFHSQRDYYSNWNLHDVWIFDEEAVSLHVDLVIAYSIRLIYFLNLLRGECSCGRLYLVPNSHLWLLEFGFFPAVTRRATVTTGVLNQVRVSGVVCASTPGMSDSRTSHLPPLKKSYGRGDSNPSTALEVLGCARRKHPDWFDDNDAEISNLLAEKNGQHKAYMDSRTDVTKAAFFRCRRLVQQRLREMQDAWMIRNAEEIERHAERNEKKNCFKAIKAIYRPFIKGTAPLLSSDGTTLLTCGHAQ
ncbi:unnamed protein product [Schistocephalus solidus]|uniref:Uncharacterized protein n=1 Tax=Schistocephalus solidus TaxID=70667 RepID=A0A183TP62_SCHSO|nr:unnamed protein product [Schistocephalus solidus]